MIVNNSYIVIRRNFSDFQKNDNLILLFTYFAVLHEYKRCLIRSERQL